MVVVHVSVREGEHECASCDLTPPELGFLLPPPGLVSPPKNIQVVVLDLCPSLAQQAEKRVQRHADWGWGSIVKVLVADACDPKAPGLPAPGSVDVVTFSYALTMIPDWKAAIQVGSMAICFGFSVWGVRRRSSLLETM